MDVYGLTGGIGSGKSAVAALLEDFGIPVVSADELSRVVVAGGSVGLADVVEAFGADVLDDAGELDRRKMATIVFRDPSRRAELEAILHPRIRERFEQVLDALEKADHRVAVYEVPLLFEKNLQSEMKAVILVTADADLRVRRVMERDDVTETEVRARMSAQMDEALKRKRADYIIENNGSQDGLRREVQFLLQRFLRIDARAVPDPRTDDVVIARVAEEPVSGGTVIAPAPTAPTPSRTPTQVPTGAPKPAAPGAPAPSSLSTLPPSTSRPVPPKTPSPPPAPPPGVRLPTPVPSTTTAPAPTVPVAPPLSEKRTTEPATAFDAITKGAGNGAGNVGTPPTDDEAAAAKTPTGPNDAVE